MFSGPRVSTCSRELWKPAGESAGRPAIGVDKNPARMAESPIVLLSGPSGSGKTTTALKLEQELVRRGVNTHTISMDNYFKTLNRATAPRTPESNWRTPTGRREPRSQ